MHFATLIPAALLLSGTLALPAPLPCDHPALAPADAVKSPRFSNTVLLLRHGEKKRDGSVGLNAAGKRRAKCLRRLLGSSSAHNVGLILAESFDAKTKKRRRPFETVRPLARALGLRVDTECKVDDPRCVREKVERYAAEGGTGEVVVCWKHSMLHLIARELGAKATPYPDERYDVMWTLRGGRIVKKESERCPGLDPQRHSETHDDPDQEEEEEEDEEEAWEDEEEYAASTAEGAQQFSLGRERRGLNELD